MKYEFPDEDLMREALYGAKKPTEWRHVIRLPVGTNVESYDLDGNIEISVPDEYEVLIRGPGYQETTYTKATDYRDGQWHGWNGGECPVEPDDEVRTVWFDTDTGSPRMATGRAGNRFWGKGMRAIVAFRVVSRKPREYTDDDGVTWREVLDIDREKP